VRPQLLRRHLLSSGSQPPVLLSRAPWRSRGDGGGGPRAQHRAWRRATRGPCLSCRSTRRRWPRRRRGRGSVCQPGAAGGNVLGRRCLLLLRPSPSRAEHIPVGSSPSSQSEEVAWPPELRPLCWPLDLAWPPVWRSRPTLLVAVAAAPCVAHPTCLVFASEERGSVYLHLLSPRKELCIPFCISCWRRKPEGTVASVRQKCFCFPLLDSDSLHKH
jgi:hypothetical protein